MKTITFDDNQLKVLEFVLGELATEYAEAAEAETDEELIGFYREKESEIGDVYDHIFKIESNEINMEIEYLKARKAYNDITWGD